MSKVHLLLSCSLSALRLIYHLVHCQLTLGCDLPYQSTRLLNSMWRLMDVFSLFEGSQGHGLDSGEGSVLQTKARQGRHLIQHLMALWLPPKPWSTKPLLPPLTSSDAPYFELTAVESLARHCLSSPRSLLGGVVVLASSLPPPCPLSYHQVNPPPPLVRTPDAGPWLEALANDQRQARQLWTQYLMYKNPPDVIPPGPITGCDTHPANDKSQGKGSHLPHLILVASMSSIPKIR